MSAAKVVSIKTGRPLPFGGADPVSRMLTAEGWTSFGHDYIAWMHPQSSRVLSEQGAAVDGGGR